MTHHLFPPVRKFSVVLLDADSSGKTTAVCDWHVNVESKKLDQGQFIVFLEANLFLTYM